MNAGMLAVKLVKEIGNVKVRYMVLLSVLTLGLISPICRAAASEIVVQGYVHDSAGKAVSGAKVSLVPQETPYELLSLLEQGQSAPEPVDRTRSTDAGFYSLTAPAPGLWTMRATYPGKVPMELSPIPLVEDFTAPPVILVPDVGGEITVIGSDGQPAGDVMVTTQPGPSSAPVPRLHHWYPHRPSSFTNRFGRLQIPRGRDETLLLDLYKPPFQFRNDWRGVENVVRLEAQPVRRVEVTVLESTGTPVADAFVTQEGRVLPLGKTDLQGRVTLELPCQPVWQLVVSTPDGRTQVKTVAATEESASAPHPGTVQILLDDTSRLTGRVVDSASSQPVGGALVWSLAPPHSWSLTSPEGLYTLNDVGPRSGRLQALAEGFVGASERFSEQQYRALAGPSFALTPGRAVRGWVVDSKGAPVGEATIEASIIEKVPRVPPPRAVRPTQSLPNGYFQLLGLSKAAPYRLLVKAGGYATSTVRVPSLGSSDVGADFTIVLERGTVLRGTVLGPSGGPVENASVHLLWTTEGESDRAFARLLMRTGSPPPRSVEVLSTTTSEDGEFELGAVPEGRFDLVVTGPGLASLEKRLQIEGHDTEIDLGHLEMDRGQVLQGYVRDERNRPIAEASIELVIAQARTVIVDRRVGPVVTSSEGDFVIEGLKPGGNYELRVRHPEFAVQTLTGIVVPAEEPVEIVLRDASSLLGRVFDSGGTPIEGARVTALPEGMPDARSLNHRVRGAAPSVLTGPDGRFELADVEAGTLRVSAVAPGFTEEVIHDLEVLPGSEVKIQITLERGARVTGLVLDSQGRPLSGIQVEAPGSRDVSDGEGSYELQGLAAGRHSIKAWSSEYGEVSRSIEVRDRDLEVNLQFRPSQRLAGKVRSSEGEPLSDVLVHLQPSTEETVPRSQVSDPQGGFEFKSVDAGRYNIEAHRQGYAPARTRVEVEASSTEEIVLTLQPSRMIEGRLLGVSHEELATVEVRAFGPEKSVVKGHLQAEHEYLISSVAPGDWYVVARAGNPGRRAGGWVSLKAADDVVRLDLEMTEGFTLTGAIAIDGAPMVGARVVMRQAQLGDLVLTRTDREGKFEFSGLEGARFVLEVTTLERDFSLSRMVDVLADQELAIEVETGGIRGRILRSTDAIPLSQVGIRLESLSSSKTLPLPRLLRTASDGLFAAARVPAGSYRLVATKEGFRPATQQVDILAGVWLEGVDLLMRPLDETP